MFRAVRAALHHREVTHATREGADFQGAKFTRNRASLLATQLVTEDKEGSFVRVECSRMARWRWRSLDGDGGRLRKARSCLVFRGGHEVGAAGGSGKNNSNGNARREVQQSKAHLNECEVDAREDGLGEGNDDDDEDDEQQHTSRVVQAWTAREREKQWKQGAKERVRRDGRPSN